MKDYYITAYCMNTDGEPLLESKMTWRENDIVSNWTMICNLAEKCDEVLITPIETYNDIWCKDGDIITLHRELASKSIVIYFGANYNHL